MMASTSPALEIRPIKPDEWAQVLHLSETTFADPFSPDAVEQWKAISDPSRSLVALDDSAVVASCVTQPLTLTVPGGALPFAGLGLGQVRPTHRRRGLLATMLTRLHDLAREHGEPLVGGWPSESSIHTRFGWGPATNACHLTLELQYRHLLDRSDYRHLIRLADRDEAVRAAPPIYEHVQGATPGMVDRNAARWRTWADEDPWHWQGQAWTQDVGPRMFALCPERGYAVYRLQRRWSPAGPDYRVLIAELMAVDPIAYTALWQWCCDLDLTSAMAATLRPTDEPLRLMLADHRRLQVRTHDALWIRVVDTKRALEGRRYAIDGAITIEVIDDFGSWATGRYRLTVDDGIGECQPSTATPDITLPVASLSTAYLGGLKPSRLQSARRAEEHTPGSLRWLDTALDNEPEPWSPWVF